MEINFETLKRCHNCRFEAEYTDLYCDQKDQTGVPIHGMVHVPDMDDGINLFFNPQDRYADWRRFYDKCGYGYFRYVTDESLGTTFPDLFLNFKIIPRDPETYMDWQVGDKVCEDEHRNACYEVIFRSGELVVFKDWNNWASNPMTCSEAFTRFGMRLVLTDIEKQIIEEKPAEDMQALIAKELDGHTPRGRIEGFPMEVIAKMLERQYEQTGKVDVKVFEKFLSSSKEDGGFSWGCTPEGYDFWKEVLTLEDFSAFFRLYPREDKRQFRKFDPVLVRDVDGTYWIPAVFKQMCPLLPRPFQTIDGTGWKQCVPLNEETVGYLGTSEKIPNQCGKE